MRTRPDINVDHEDEREYGIARERSQTGARQPEPQRHDELSKRRATSAVALGQLVTSTFCCAPVLVKE